MKMNKKSKKYIGVIFFIFFTVSAFIMIRLFGCEILVNASSSGNVVVVKLMVLLGVNVNDSFGDNRGTALFYASGHGHVDVVNCLIASGADVNAKDARGSSPLCAALASTSSESSEVVKILLDAGSKPDSVNPFRCIRSSRTSYQHIKVMLNWGVNPNNYKGYPLYQFSYNGDLKSVILLIDCGAEILNNNIPEVNPLYAAVEQGNVDVAMYLIKMGADVNMDFGGKTLLDLAKEKRNYYHDNPSPKLADYIQVVNLLGEKRGRE